MSFSNGSTELRASDWFGEIKPSEQVDLWTYYTRQGVRSDAETNPGNRFAELSADTFTFEARPDFRAKTDLVSLYIGPRLKSEIREIETAAGSRRETGTDVSINRWEFEVRPSAPISFKVGRSSLVWGPALFRSPGNPFSFDNGREDPTAELNGKDYAELNYTLSSKWTISAISNFGKGRTRTPNDPFKSEHALKVDFTGDSYTLSATASLRNGDPAKLSGFAQWTATASVLTYAEWSVGGRNRGYYPEAFSPTGTFSQSERESTPATGLLGGSYTFNSGHVLSVEMLVNNSGYTASEMHQYRDVVRRSQLFLDSPAWGALAARNFGDALNNNLVLERRHYLFMELQNAIGGNYLWNVRYTQNIDDGSGQVSGYFECNVTNYAQIFLLSYRNFGGRLSEFRQLTDYEWRVGIHVTF